jgi:dihydrofolate reductase
MAKLIYSAIASLDGYIEDEDGKFDWAAPDEEVLAFVNDLERPVGTYLLGRRMYETLAVWETDPSLAGQSPTSRDFAAIWQAAGKTVYSRTLQAASSQNADQAGDPDAVRRAKGQWPRFHRGRGHLAARRSGRSACR